MAKKSRKVVNISEAEDFNCYLSGCLPKHRRHLIAFSVKHETHMLYDSLRKKHGSTEAAKKVRRVVHDLLVQLEKERVKADPPHPADLVRGR